MKNNLLTILTMGIFAYLILFASSANADEVTEKFTGQEQDANGLYYYGSRYYDPDLGRFTQPDSITPSLTSQGLNPYSYVNNNPVNFTDPTGHNGVPTNDELINQSVKTKYASDVTRYNVYRDKYGVGTLGYADLFQGGNIAIDGSDGLNIDNMEMDNGSFGIPSDKMFDMSKALLFSSSIRFAMPNLPPLDGDSKRYKYASLTYGDLDLLANMMYSEALTSDEAMGVLNVALNRLGKSPWKGKTLSQILKQPGAFNGLAKNAVGNARSQFYHGILVSNSTGAKGFFGGLTKNQINASILAARAQIEKYADVLYATIEGASDPTHGADHFGSKADFDYGNANGIGIHQDELIVNRTQFAGTIFFNLK